MVERKCSDCKYVDPFGGSLAICKCKESPYYNQEVDMISSCEYFISNPAEDYYIKGIRAGLLENRDEEITNLKQALQLGLPPRTEVECRAWLAIDYIKMRSYDCDDSSNVEAWIQDEKVTKGLEYFEKSLALDASNTSLFGERYISPFTESNPFRFSAFKQSDMAYTLISKAIKRKHGIDSAIFYLQEKIRLFEYLPETWMPHVYFELGALFGQKGQTRGEQLISVIYFEKVSKADANYSEGMKKEYQNLHNTALDNLIMSAQDTEAITELQDEEKGIKKEIDRLRRSITDKLKEAGIMAYSLFVEGKMQVVDKEVKEVLSQIESINEQIGSLDHQMEELKAQQPTGGFFSRLKDKASSTAKTAKIQLDIRSQRKKKEQVMPVLGEGLYASYKTGVSTPSALQPTWKTVDELKEEIKHKEAEYSSFEEALNLLELYKSE